MVFASGNLNRAESEKMLMTRKFPPKHRFLKSFNKNSQRLLNRRDIRVDSTKQFITNVNKVSKS